MSSKCYNVRYLMPKAENQRRVAPLPVRRAERQIAQHLVAWRKLRGLTQTQLADRSGVARGTIQRIEAAEKGVSVENLLRVLRGLGLLENLPRALDPLASDVGRLRSDERLPQRVRPRQLAMQEPTTEQDHA
jgi:transcriptional regulator with XRE-family HTH domain